jgi:hypothetical protein
MVEGVEVDAADGDAGGVEGEELAPDFFFRGVEGDDDDGVGVHGREASLQSRVESRKWKEKAGEHGSGGWRCGGIWVILSLNPHPLRAEGAAPKFGSRRSERADLGAAVLRPYIGRTTEGGW